MTNTCPFIDINGFTAKQDERQKEIIFAALQNIKNKNCKNSIQKTLETSNNFLSNLKIVSKYIKNKINLKIYLLISLIIFVILSSICLYKLFN
jgi:hypothetical protein